MNRLLVLVLCIFSASLFVKCTPTITESSVKIKDLNVLGAKLKLATYNLTFNEDLYLHKSNYCPTFNCASDNVVYVNQQSCVCDYTNTTHCGNGFQLNSPSTSCSCDNSICQPSAAPWTDVTLAGRKTFATQLNTSESRHWRLFVSSKCSGFKIHVTTFYGTTTLFVSTENQANLKNAVWTKTNRFEKEQVVICPTDPHYVQGTYFIAVTASTSAVFELTVEELMVAQPSVASPSTCGDLSEYPWLADAECLYDGVPASFSNIGNTSIEVPSYVFNVSFANRECAPVFVHLQEYALGQKSSFNIIFPSKDNSTQYSSSTQESFMMCSSPSETWALIQIEVISASPEIGGISQHNYRLTVSTSHFDSHWTHTRLIDIPSFEVNFELLGSAAVDALPYGIEAGASSKITCNDWRADCKGLSFAISENPLFPVPPILLNLPGADVLRTIVGNYSIDVPVTGSKTFTAVVLLSYITDTANVSIIPDNSVQEISIEFRGKVGSRAGSAIVGSFTATTQKQLHCNYKEYLKYQKFIKELMDDVSYISDTATINTMLYQLESAAFQDGFQACEDLVESLTVGTSNTSVVTRKYVCPYPSGSEGFFADPCCTGQAELSSTCYLKNVTSYAADFAIQPQAQNTCKNFACSSAYLQDYSDTKATLENGQCSINLASQTSRKQSAIKNYLKCKDQAFSFAGKTCNRDSDCFYSFDNITYTCSMTSRTCVLPYQVMERSFMQCLRSKLSALQEIYLDRKYNWTFSIGDPRLLAAWTAQATKNDCVSLYGNSVNLEHRQKYVTSPTDSDCADKYNCDSFECEDSTCQYPENTCQQTCGMTQVKEQSSSTQCTAEAVCNWDSTLCEGQSLSTCTTLCQGSNFCGFCDSFGDCTQFSEISTSQECSSTSVCILPNGTYFFNLTDAQCNGLTQCDLSYCGRECAIASSTNSAFESGICFSYEDNSVDCVNNGGSWEINTGAGAVSSEQNICVYAGVSDSTTCANYNNAQWESCRSISLSACTNNNSPLLTQNLMTCAIRGKPCSSNATCSSSGICSDSNFLVDMTSASQLYGACVIPRLTPTDSTSFLYCPPGMITLPKQCAFDPSVVKNEQECSNAISLLPESYKSSEPFWLKPAETKSECLNLSSATQSGCQELYGNQLRFSQKTNGNCTQANTAWANAWRWQQGHWIGGVKRSLSWTSRHSYSKYNWTSTLDYTQLEEDFIGVTDSRSASESRSAILCQYQLSLDPMQAVSCDCSNSGSSNCFDVEASTLIGQTVACQNISAVRNYTGMMISFYNDTVPISCISLRIAKLSKESFATSTSQKLLSNFIPLTEKKLPSYAIKNERGTVVGNILTDGVSVKPLGVNVLGIFGVCILLSDTVTAYQPPSSYPVLDFGFKNSSLADVTIMNVTVSQKVINSTVYLCADVGNILTETSYFGIERKANYDTEEDSLLSPTASALTYTLAVMFLIASLLTTGQLGFYIYNWVVGNIPLLLEHFLCLFIWMFVNVRTIYFFLLVGGFDSNTADYALVVLPTFFYFTAFTIIVVLWAVVASKKFNNDAGSFQKLIHKIVIGVNSALYALFLVVVLSFQFATETTNSPCVSGSEDNSSELKRNISIAYGIIIAVVSLVIGVLFVVFGFKLRMHITSQTHDKVFIVTGVCSICFILHSAFIVAVAVMPTPNLFFSFFGLVITEWFPALFIICWVFVKRASHVSSSQEKSSVNLNTMKKSGSPCSLDGGSSGSNPGSRRADSIVSESL